jgi:hypothetical protein
MHAGELPARRRFDRIREHLRHRHQCDFAELQREIDELEREVHCLAAQCHQPPDSHPTAGTITATTKDGTVTDTYAPGQTIYLTAGNFTNAENAPVTGTVTGQWSSDQGTITPNPNNADEATLVNVPLGDFNVTFTADSGLVLTYQGTVADDVAVSGTITGSTTPPADETPASA